MEENKEYQQVTGSIYKHIQEAPDEELLSDEVRDKFPPYPLPSEEFKEDKYSEIRFLEMMRRLKNSIQDLDKNTRNYSGKLIDLTILLFFVALIQVLVSIIAIPETWLNKILIFGMVFYAIYYAIRRITAEKNK